MKRVLVVGSLNCDLVMRAPRRPQRGETVLGTSFHTFVGGKGCNQALACARAGAAVSLLGRVGKDAFADVILAVVKAAGIDGSWIVRDIEVGTGVADIFVEDDGASSICVAPRANGRLSPADIDAALAHMGPFGVALLQLEVPEDTVRAAAARAKAAGALVVLNAAPAPPSGDLAPDLWANVDVMVTNQTEARTLTGCSADAERGAASAARIMMGRGVGSVLVTMGERGALLVTASGEVAIPAFEVAVVDTTGAGDAFSGALAARLAAGDTLEAATRWGCAAGALACTKLGAEPSLPMRSDIEALVRLDPVCD